MKQLPRRLESIDVFRALTMFLMIFVNELDGIKNVPEWWKHVPDDADGLGFADTIFPAFLFIVGLSLPFAIKNRIARGESTAKIATYISLRGLALLIMGFFHVNLEEYNMDAILPRYVWQFIITISFFLVWLDYPDTMQRTKRWFLQGTGIALLITMAALYTDENEHWMSTSWWGILGLIGWAYLLCAFIFLFTKGKLLAQVVAFILLFSLSIASHATVHPVLGFIEDIWIINNGSLASLTMAGVVVSVAYGYMSEKGKSNLFLSLLPAAGIFMIIIGFALRPFGGISKVHDTPSWVGICTGISMIVFTGMILLIDVKEKKNWFRFISPAGTSTLTCYLIPYLLYAFYASIHLKFPEFLNEGAGGFLRSVATAVVVVAITGVLERKRIRLKI
jgi:predicted acyltransferase